LTDQNPAPSKAYLELAAEAGAALAVHITNREDEEQYVDVQRALKSLLDELNGTFIEICG